MSTLSLPAWTPRALGWVTAAYSTAIIVRPQLLGGPCGYTGPNGSLPRSTATLIAAIGARDVASGLAMAFAPEGPALRTATKARVAADLSDAVLFGIGLRGTGRTTRIAGFAALWGSVCAATLILPQR